MKTLIVLVVGLLAVGCGKTKLQQEVLRDSIIGEYEHKSEPGDPSTYVFLENGIVENWDFQPNRLFWTISNGQIHVDYGERGGSVYRINQDKSITVIANIDKDGKRTDVPKEDQITWKKIK